MSLKYAIRTGMSENIYIAVKGGDTQCIINELKYAIRTGIPENIYCSKGGRYVMHN
jgi:hypothetical protein